MSSAFAPDDDAFAQRVRQSFAEQSVMALIGARLARIDAGAVDIELPYRADLCQQDGFLHAGISSTILDSACGYAALTLMPAAARVLTIEFKINLLAPAAGSAFSARGRVRRAGRSVTVAEADLVALGDDRERLVATMTGTLMTVRPRAGD